MSPSSVSISSPLKQRIQGFFFPAMARRPYTTVLGCITCEELDDFGAGKEGWLVDNPNLICALDSHFLALANRSIILVLGWAGSDGYKVKIRPSDLSPIKAEYISALEWLVFDEFKVLLVGTSCGYLLIYSSNGDLILKQVVPFHHRAITVLKSMTKKSKSGFYQQRCLTKKALSFSL